MSRTLFTTENCLREILNSPSSVWFSLINKQDNIVISTNSSDNKIELDSIIKRLHNKQIRVLPETNIVNQLPNTPLFLENLCDCLFLLDIPFAQAEEIGRDYGICCFSSHNYDSPYIVKKGWEVRTDDNDPKIVKSWKYFYEGVIRNCTSAIIIDRFLFSREWNKGNGCPDDTIDLCIFNLKCIMDSIIPFNIGDGRFCLTIIFNHEGVIKCEKRDNEGKIEKDQNGKTIYIYYTFKEFVKIVEAIKEEIDRPFVYDIEVLSVNRKCKYYNDTHDRYVITNFHITRAPHKLVTYTPDEKPLYKQTLFFDYIYSKGIEIDDKSSMPIATKESVLSAMRELLDLSDHNKIYYAQNGNEIEFNKNKRKPSANPVFPG